MSDRAATQEWYGHYYERLGQDRNDLLRNPEVLYQYLAFEEAFVRALGSVPELDRLTAVVLDVGCGKGDGLGKFIQLGFPAANLHGLDILAERIHLASAKFPGVRFACEDATAMPYPSGTFDLAYESTMFVQITDEGVARAIAREMLRVVKPGGHILLVDWRYGKPGNRQYRGVSWKRIRALFEVGSASTLVARRPGALVPPLGRRLSRYAPALYFPVRAIAGFAVGSVATLLRRSEVPLSPG